jgi:hypothetical protein
MMATFIFVDGELYERYSSAKPVTPGSIIYTSDNRRCLARQVAVEGGAQIVDVEILG